jgi:hypothetical protein
MSVFAQLGKAAQRAREQGLISAALAERIGVIASHCIHYKHLGLELHGLIGQLVPAAESGQRPPATALEEMVRQIEDRSRRP